MTNNSIFTRVLALMICLVMLAGTLSACFQETTHKNNAGTTIEDNGIAIYPSTTPSIPDTGDVGNKDPETEPVDPNVIFSASANISAGSLIYGTLAKSLMIGRPDLGAIIPADVKIEAGAQNLALSVKNVEENNVDFGDAQHVKSLDVHINGIAADNTVPMIVNLGAVLEAGLGDTELKLYHIENGTPVLMTRVNSIANFGIHNQYVYDSETGNVTIYVASFSVFTAVQTTASKWEDGIVTDTSWYNENDTVFTLEDVADFLGFRDLVDAGNTFEGKTVILDTDIDLANKPFDPIGFGYYKDDKRTEVEGVVTDTNTVFLGTFDGGNHTIYNLYENCWELDPDKTNYGTYTYSTAGAGLFASIKNATIKNIAISGAEIVFECVDMGVLVGYAQGECHFENIVITDANIANYNRYTGGLVGEVSYGVDNNGDGYSHTFKNITIDSTVTVSGLWGSFGCGMGGVIGGKWGDATVKMENVVSAPVMDVYNDVVSAYQWYAFRGCGMLIGHTEEPYSDGRLSGNATASFLTCVNVNVYYGDWTKYNYYEFAKQDSATGRNYPWVRAEAGEYCDAFSNIRYGVPTHTVEGVTTAVSELSPEELEKVATGHVVITFDQLYGADRGMYGTNKHKGVNVSYSSPKTFYIKNNVGLENLTLHYTYEIGEETWTTIPDGVELVEFNGVYRIDLPEGAKSFTITADGGFESKEFIVSELTENATYPVHDHEFVGNSCECGATKITDTVTISDYADANGWVNDKQYKEVVIGGIKVTAVGGGNTGKYYTNGNNWRIYQSENATVVITSNGDNIVSVKITYQSENTGVLVYNATNIASGEVVDVNANSITFDVSNTGSATNGQVRITAIEVVYILENHECNQKEVVKGKDATCTETGLTDGAKCDVCGNVTLEQAEIPMIDHAWNDATCEAPKTCSACGATEGEPLEHTTENGVCVNCGNQIGGTTPDPETPTESGWIETELANIKPTDVVVIVWKTKDGKVYAISNDKGTSDAPTAVKVTIDGNKLSADPADNIQWNISNDNGNLTIYPKGTTATWLYCNSSNNGVRVGTNANKTFTIDASSGYLKHTGTGRYLGVYTTNPDVRCYTSTGTNISNQTLAFYVLTNGGTSGGETPCQHPNTTETTVDATCTKAGSITVTCDDCGVDISEETIPVIPHTDVTTDDNHNCDVCGAENVTDHNYVDGTCDCGAKDPNAGSTTEPVEATLSFANKTQRTSFSTTKQVWEQNGIVFTNEKSSSTNNIADYANPVRLYAGSNIVIEAEGITKIVFDCNSSSYATALKNSIGTVSGATVTVSSDKVTVEFTTPVGSFTIAKLTAQVRMDSITVTYTK